MGAMLQSLTKIICMLIRIFNAWLIVFLAIGFAPCLLARPEIEQPEKTKTNVLVLFVDDLGSGDLGMHGGVSRTPNINRLAPQS